jgi:pimeloyl-ACP methyl ester carboxylesterase
LHDDEVKLVKPFGRKAMAPSRRAIVHALALGIGSLLLPRSAKSQEPPDLDEDLRNLRLMDLMESGRRFVLIVPRYQNPDQKIPLVVFLHGLGETTNERLGAYAWVEKYGLGSAWQRLKRPPIERTSKRGEWTDARLAEVNAELQAREFRGFAMACPFMPNPSGAGDLDAYARWIDEALIPRCRKEARVFDDAKNTHLCGCSLGGYVSLEVLARKPKTFHAWAGVQTAIGEHAVPRYVERIGERPVLLVTSTQDSFRSASEAFAIACVKKGIKAQLRVPPGPHDQPWLREAGTIEAMHWLDRRASEAS